MCRCTEGISLSPMAGSDSVHSVLFCFFFVFFDSFGAAVNVFVFFSPVLSYCYGYYVAVRCINIKQMVIVSCFLLFLLSQQQRKRIEIETNEKIIKLIEVKSAKTRKKKMHKTKSIRILSALCTDRLPRHIKLSTDNVWPIDDCSVEVRVPRISQVIRWFHTFVRQITSKNDTQTQETVSSAKRT